jgi:hypothetical protein
LGSYSVTVTGTGGGVSNSTMISLKVESIQEEVRLKADPTSLRAGESVKLTTTYSVYEPGVQAVNVEVWEDTHFFGFFDKRLCSVFGSVGSDQTVECVVRGSALGLLWPVGTHDLYAKVLLASPTGTTQARMKSSIVVVTVTEWQWWPMSLAQESRLPHRTAPPRISQSGARTVHGSIILN